MDFEESMCESSSPQRGLDDSLSVTEKVVQLIQEDVIEKLMNREFGEEVNSSGRGEFRRKLVEHFNRLPSRYTLDVNTNREEDVLLHLRIFAQCADQDNQPVFHARFLRYETEPSSGCDDTLPLVNTSLDSNHQLEGSNCNCQHNLRCLRDDYEACSRLEGLSLNLRLECIRTDDQRYPTEAISARKDLKVNLLHEVIFSSLDKPKLLSQLSSSLSDMELNIREAHVFSTHDGYCLDIFVVEGWHSEDTDSLLTELKEKMSKRNASVSNSSNSSSSDKVFELQEKIGDFEIDASLLKIEAKIASGSSGDLYHGIYQGQDVGIKALRSSHQNCASEVEFAQEVMILRKIQHRNIVRFFGACMIPPDFCIVTEYMHGGNLYDFLHKDHNRLSLCVLLRMATDISKGMEYLHQNKIIHRDLKTANLLLDAEQVVKVADFGVARVQSATGDMTSETGTYRWMAPEVINHKPYDFKADVFSFAIVLWEMATSKVPYDNLTPLQAAIGVRQGNRPDIPKGMHPRLSKLMQRCWQENPAERMSFSEITVELEDLMQQAQENMEANRRGRIKILKKSDK